MMSGSDAPDDDSSSSTICPSEPPDSPEDNTNTRGARTDGGVRAGYPDLTVKESAQVGREVRYISDLHLGEVPPPQGDLEREVRTGGYKDKFGFPMFIETLDVLEEPQLGTDRDCRVTLALGPARATVDQKELLK